MGISLSKCDELEEQETMHTGQGYGFSLTDQNDGSSVTIAKCSFEHHFRTLEQEVTTRIAVRVRPNLKGTDATNKECLRRHWECPWTVIDYYCDANRGKQNLYISGDVAGILLQTISSRIRQGPATSKLILFQIAVSINIAYINMNDFEGRIWWNGFTMKLNGNPSTRLEFVSLEMDPLRLTFKNKSTEEIEVVRSAERLELIGKQSGLEDKLRTLRIYGPDVSKIEAKATPNDGTILLTFPPYKHNADMEVVWPDYYPV